MSLRSAIAAGQRNEKRQLKALMARRSVIVAELSKLSRNGWANARPVDYQPLEAELRAINARRQQIEDKQ
jgi:hypothetical protein